MLPVFFKDVLGEQGVAVMTQLSKALPALESYLTPRIIVGWLRKSEYGPVSIPKDCPIESLSKTGYGYSGTITIDSQKILFKHSSEEYIAAVVAVASKQNIEPVEIKDLDLARLAKTIDLLIESQPLFKSAPKAPPNQFEHQVPASNLQPEEPIQPETKQPAQNQKKKPVKLKIPKIKPAFKPLQITKSEVQNKCPICGNKMFLENTFVGCPCFEPMAKCVKTTSIGSNFVLSFSEDWDQDAYLALIGALKNG